MTGFMFDSSLTIVKIDEACARFFNFQVLTLYKNDKCEEAISVCLSIWNNFLSGLRARNSLLLRITSANRR
jgi:hypothetical protein